MGARWYPEIMAAVEAERAGAEERLEGGSERQGTGNVPPAAAATAASALTVQAH